MAKISGTNRNDVLAAGADGDRVFGLGGDDRLSSQFSRTLLSGDGGRDRLLTDFELVVEPSGPRAGSGRQSGGGGADSLTVNLLASGADSAVLTRLLAEVSGDGGDDVIRVSSSFDEPTSGRASNVVDGGDGDDRITAEAIAGAPARVEGVAASAARNAVRGGEGNDRIVVRTETTGDFGSAKAEVRGDRGNDSIVSRVVMGGTFVGPGENSLDGGAGNDTLTATTHAGAFFDDATVPGATNTLVGRDGNDVLDATMTIDDAVTTKVLVNTLSGGAGSDTLNAEIIEPEFIQTEITARNLLEGGDGKDTLRARIELSIGAEPSLDTTATNTQRGGAGNDEMTAMVGVRYGGGDDASRLTLARNVLRGDDGNDQIIGIAAAVFEGPADELGTTRASNLIFGGEGDDEIAGEIGIDSLGRSELHGDDGDDTLTVGNGTGNILDGGAGVDTMTGGVGDDTFFVDSRDDVTTEEAAGSTDTVVSSVSRVLDANLENLILRGGAVRGTGNAEANEISGNSLGNRLDGADGDDTITGGGGPDEIEGSDGNDALRGGRAADTFLFDVDRDEGTDTLGDFRAAEDRLFFFDIVDAGAAGLADDLEAVTFVTDAGLGLDVTVSFAGGTVLVFEGRGTGEVDSIADLVDDPIAQLLGPEPLVLLV